MQRGDEVYLIHPGHHRHLHRGILYGYHDDALLCAVAFPIFVYTAVEKRSVYLADDMPF